MKLPGGESGLLLRIFRPEGGLSPALTNTQAAARTEEHKNTSSDHITSHQVSCKPNRAVYSRSPGPHLWGAMTSPGLVRTRTSQQFKAGLEVNHRLLEENIGKISSSWTFCEVSKEGSCGGLSKSSELEDRRVIKRRVLWDVTSPVLTHRQYVSQERNISTALLC